MAERPAVNDNERVFTMTRAELESLVSRAVGQAFIGITDERGGRLLDRNELALRLSCSAGHVDKMRRDGMPCLYLGDSPRFVFADCVRWLSECSGAARRVGA